ncbi:MAG: FeS assembly system protein [Ignavibacteria bacterium]|nr:FeS assembly system protein [Ignavibacteria bacterium]
MENNIDLNQLETKIIEVLKDIYDPEIPVNIFDLGLVYNVGITKELEVVILMTLTSPNCPVAESLPMEVQQHISEIPGVKSTEAVVTFDPPWDRSMLSEAAKLDLGLW